MNQTATDWLAGPALLADDAARRAARVRQSSLTKPPGALGRLEDIAVQLAALQGAVNPRVDRVRICVFAGDHGVAEEGVSAFPQAVTAQMVRNFAAGGAAICVASRALGAPLEVVNLGTVQPLEALPRVTDCRLGPGTANFTRQPAMTEAQLAQAMAAGRDAVHKARSEGSQLFIGGEMGIGNTTSAAALACVLLGDAPFRLAGPGTGLTPHAVVHKTRIIQRALDLHAHHASSPAEALRRLGGFEIAALAGAYVTCAQEGLPALVDGFISSVAALAATRLCNGSADWLLFSHVSAEPGHARVLRALDAQPLLDLGMRLGEGSGAAVAVPLLRMACDLHNGMATFAEGQVAGALHSCAAP